MTVFVADQMPSPVDMISRIHSIPLTHAPNRENANQLYSTPPMTPLSYYLPFNSNQSASDIESNEFIPLQHSHPRYIFRSCSKRWDLNRRGGQDHVFPLYKEPA